MTCVISVLRNYKNGNIFLWLIKRYTTFNVVLGQQWHSSLRVWKENTCINIESQGINPIVLRLEYSRRHRSISWLLMPWLLVSPRHQQQWHWLCKINFAFTEKNITIMATHQFKLVTPLVRQWHPFLPIHNHMSKGAEVKHYGMAFTVMRRF